MSGLLSLCGGYRGGGCARTKREERLCNHLECADFELSRTMEYSTRFESSRTTVRSIGVPDAGFAIVLSVTCRTSIRQQLYLRYPQV